MTERDAIGGASARPRRRRWLHDMAVLARALHHLALVRAGLSLRRTSDIRAQIAAVHRAHALHSPRPQQTHAACAAVAWSVTAMARFVPGASCLTQAFAAQNLLARRGVTACVRLTVDRHAAAQIHPHAWVLVGDTLLLGGTSHEYLRHEWLLDYHADGSVNMNGTAVPGGIQRP